MSDQAQKMFRKSALEKLSSPERLDTLMEVTSPAGWLALLSLSVIIALVALWSVIGSVSTKVEGSGILLRGASVLAVTSDTVGRVTELLVKPGDIVEQGQVVARLRQDDLELRIQNQRALLEDLVRQDSTLSTEGLEASLREKIQSQQLLVQRGLLTRGQLMATQEQLASIRRQAASRKTEIEQLRRQLSELEGRLVATSQVVSPYAGRVLELSTDTGELIAPGNRIFTLEESAEPIDTILYVSASEGKKIRPGMEVRVSPSTVKPEEFGFIIGRVEDVSDFPVTPDGLRRVLRNETLVSQLAGAGAPFEVKVKLLRDPNTPSGFKWSSSEGPPTDIYTGTLCSGSVVVERKKPISYVLPVFKSGLGG